MAGCALCAGGSVANTISRLAFGPVTDFIPEPLRSGWQCNPADIATWVGSWLIGVALALLFLDYWRLWVAARAQPAAKPLACNRDW